MDATIKSATTGRAASEYFNLNNKAHLHIRDFQLCRDESAEVKLLTD